MNPNTFPLNGSCIVNNSDHHCNINYKTDFTSTYFSPTDIEQQDNVKQMTIGPGEWPTVTHVHGLEVRPAFDGNPLSWTSNSGKYGVAALSL